MARMFLAGLAALALAGPAAAATSSSDLEVLATTLEQNAASNTTLNSQLLNALREPAKTLENRALPTTAALYTKSVETAWKLMPAGFIPQVWQHYAPAAGGANCSAMLAYWDTSPGGGLKMETFAWGKGNCASVSAAAIARGWAWKLRQIGR
jgi:hypothetical protein